MTSAGGGAAGFMIAVCDTPACSFEAKVHADVSQTAIMGRVAGAGTPDRTRNAKFPGETPAIVTRATNSNKARAGPLLWVCSGLPRGFEGSGSAALPGKITESDTQPCTFRVKVHGCVSQTAILPEPGQYDLAI